MSEKKPNYRRALMQSVKVAGQMMIDNAEDIVGDMDCMSYLSISVDFDPELRWMPELTITRSHLPDGKSIETIFKALKEKENEENI